MVSLENENASAAEREVRLEQVPCPFCGAADAQKVLEAPGCCGPGDLLFQVMRCRTCSLLYTNPRPARESVSLFYPEDYEPHREFNAQEEIARAKRWKRGLRGWFLQHAWNRQGSNTKHLRVALTALRLFGMHRRFRRLPEFREGARILQSAPGKDGLTPLKERAYEPAPAPDRRGSGGEASPRISGEVRGRSPLRRPAFGGATGGGFESSRARVVWSF